MILCSLLGVPKLLHKTVVVCRKRITTLWSSCAHLHSFFAGGVMNYACSQHAPLHVYSNAHPFSFLCCFCHFLSWALEECFTQRFSVITIKYICWTWDGVILLWWICNMPYMYFWYYCQCCIRWVVGMKCFWEDMLYYFKQHNLNSYMQVAMHKMKEWRHQSGLNVKQKWWPLIEIGKILTSCLINLNIFPKVIHSL